MTSSYTAYRGHGTENVIVQSPIEGEIDVTVKRGKLFGVLGVVYSSAAARLAFIKLGEAIKSVPPWENQNTYLDSLFSPPHGVPPRAIERNSLPADWVQAYPPAQHAEEARQAALEETDGEEAPVPIDNQTPEEIRTELEKSVEGIVQTISSSENMEEGREGLDYALALAQQNKSTPYAHKLWDAVEQAFKRYEDNIVDMLLSDEMKNDKMLAKEYSNAFRVHMHIPQYIKSSNSVSELIRKATTSRDKLEKRFAKSVEKLFK